MERPITFESAGGQVVGILHLPDDAEALHGTIAARVITALREFDTESSGIDIGVDAATGQPS